MGTNPHVMRSQDRKCLGYFISVAVALRRPNSLYMRQLLSAVEKKRYVDP